MLFAADRLALFEKFSICPAFCRQYSIVVVLPTRTLARGLTVQIVRTSGGKPIPLIPG
jgi:hypothetical protein